MDKQKILKIIDKLETVQTDVDSYAEILRQGLDEIRAEVMKYDPQKVTIVSGGNPPLTEYEKKFL